MTHSELHNDLFKQLEGLEDMVIALLGDLRGKLIDWLAEAARGELSLAELVSLLKGEKALLEATALKTNFEAKVLLNSLKKGLISELLEAVEREL